MADVAEICGDDVAQELWEKLPGILLHVPKKENETTRLNRVSESTKALIIKEFGGDNLVIPSARRKAKDTLTAIEALLDQGLTSQDIALKLGVTQSYLFKLRREAGVPKIAARPDPKQLPLFE